MLGPAIFGDGHANAHRGGGGLRASAGAASSVKAPAHLYVIVHAIDSPGLRGGTIYGRRRTVNLAARCCARCCALAMLLHLLTPSVRV